MGSETIELRVALATDVDGIRAIDALVYPRAWSEHMTRQQVNRADRTHVVAIEGGSIVGHAGLLFQAGDGHVSTIAVHPNAQQRSVGRNLLLALMRCALAADLTAVTLEVRSHNEAALALYRSFGLAPAGIRRGYYTDTGDDALVLWSPELEGEYLSRIRSMRFSDHIRLDAILGRIDAATSARQENLT
ncbi:MAG: ribosomal protein S18-alanine N-acetyltransferase [Acidimicrobiales bacterium]